MTTKDIMELDFRIPKNAEIIQNVLKKIKPFEKYQQSDACIPLENIEKLVGILTRKYDMHISDILCSCLGADTQNGVNIIHTAHLLIDGAYTNCSGMSLYELFAKVAIRMYSEVKAGKAREREIPKQELEKQKRIQKLSERGSL